MLFLSCKNLKVNKYTDNRESKLPGLYHAADELACNSQKLYFSNLRVYLLLLILAAALSFDASNNAWIGILPVILFLTTLGILIYLRIFRPDDTWYNGRAVAESVKTRSWRWMMRAEPYNDPSTKIVSEKFISDLKSILKQNCSLAGELPTDAHMDSPISEEMQSVQAMPLPNRMEFYQNNRIQDQAKWYSNKASFNKKRARQWFWISVALHSLAIVLLLIRIVKPTLEFPIGVIATSASGVLTWLQTKRHNVLASSYTLTAHEITLIKGEGKSIVDEEEFSNFVVNTEAAFSREHTQWAARRNN